MIDTHCHLNFNAFYQDLKEVIKRAKQAGLTEIIIPGAKLSSSKKATEISNKYNICYSAVGIHPHHVTEYINKSETKVLERLEELLKIRKTVAIGEIGMDYYHYKDYPPVTQENKNRQIELFRLQLKLARKNNLPVIIHCREAQSDLLETITDFIKYYGKIEGVFHCFDGNQDYLSSVLNLGFYIGFDGNITYKNNQRLINLVKLTPLNRLLLETDAPYLTPEPFRGTRNEPAYLTHIINFVAQNSNTKPEIIEKITSKNARILFKLKKKFSSDKITLL